MLLTCVVLTSTKRFVAKRLSVDDCTDSVGRATVIIKPNSTVIFSQTSFKDNMNGAIYIGNEANATFIRSRFEGNKAIKKGRALYVADNSNVEVVKSVFIGKSQAMNDKNSTLLMFTTLSRAL